MYLLYQIEMSGGTHDWIPIRKRSRKKAQTPEPARTQITHRQSTPPTRKRGSSAREEGPCFQLDTLFEGKVIFRKPDTASELIQVRMVRFVYIQRTLL